VNQGTSQVDSESESADSGLKVSVNLDFPTEDDSEDLDNQYIRRNPTGQPRHNILDQLLTVEVNTPRSQHRKHRCRGVGCTKTWQPRVVMLWPWAGSA
jgi:hypothetical protein